jgi:hypothetical protein
MMNCEECFNFEECLRYDLCNTFIAEEELMMQDEQIARSFSEYEEYAEAYWDYISDEQ